MSSTQKCPHSQHRNVFDAIDVSLIPNSEHWNPLDVQSYNPPSTFADQLSDPSSVLYINTSIPNSLFLLPPGTPSGMAAFAWSVGVSPHNLFGICLSIFLAILAGIILISLFIWMIDSIFSRKSFSTSLPTSVNKGRSPRQSAGSKDMLDNMIDESRSLSGHTHAYPTLRRRWLRPNFSSFHSSVLIGNLVRVLSLFHFPVTVFSAYEFSTATSSSSIALGALSFAVFSVILPALLLLRLARTPTSKLYDETRTLLSLGPLYNHFRPGSQLFSGLLLLSNLVNGVVIGGGQRSGTAQAIVILISEVVTALITSIWLPWGTGAGMSLISFLFCVARIVIAVLLVVLTPTVRIKHVIAPHRSFMTLLFRFPLARLLVAGSPTAYSSCCASFILPCPSSCWSSSQRPLSAYLVGWDSIDLDAQLIVASLARSPS